MKLYQSKKIIRFSVFSAYLIIIAALLPSCGVDEETAAVNERNRRWVYDVEQMQEHILGSHPKFIFPLISSNPENIQLQQDFIERTASLLENIPNLTELEIKAEIQRGIALFRDNHFFFDGFTGWLSQMRLERHPLEFARFDTGFYLIHAQDDFKHALNLRVTAVNGIPIEDVFAEFTRFWSVETPYDAAFQFAHHLNAVKVLEAMGINDGETTVYTLASPYGNLDITVNQTVLWQRSATTLRWLPATTMIDNRSEGDLPMFWRNRSQNLWHEFIPEYGILYVCIRAWVPSPDAFINAVEETARQNSINAVIIDARGNPGGNAGLYVRLFDFLASSAPEGLLFYFVDGGSNSGTLNAAYMLENRGAVLLGQPLGQFTSFYHFATGTPRAVTLNYSVLNIIVPSAYWNGERVYGRAPEDMIFRPHIKIKYSLEDWINNRDPLFDFVIYSITNANR